MRKEYLGKEKYCSELKKGKLKTKKLLKVTRRTRALCTISRQKQSSASLNLRKYLFSKTWKVGVAASIYLKINSGFHARKNLKQQYLKVVTFSNSHSAISHSAIVTFSNILKQSHSVILHSAKGHLCLRSCSLDNTLNKLPNA